jgi:diguanylate cyclase (GGDEF)-like protein
VDEISLKAEHLSLYPLTRSELCVPLKVEDKLLGVINVESHRPAAFTREDEELLTIIAGQLATAIQRLRNAQAEHYQTRQLERSNSLIKALAQVNARAAAVADLDGVMQTLGKELTGLGMQCIIALTDSANRNVLIRYMSLPGKTIRALERVSRTQLQNYSIPLEQLSPFAYTDSLPCIIRDPLSLVTLLLPSVPRRGAIKILEQIGISDTTSVCHLPLITEGKPHGILWMWGEGVHESDLPTISLFASQIATALQNASLMTEIKRLAITDDLTGIYNRRHFFEIAGTEFSRAVRHDYPLSALIVDVDHFKQFNDRYGHATGDRVLREVAHLMLGTMRESDILGRYGGEEFSVLLPVTEPKAAIRLAERIISNVADVPIDTDAGKLSVQLSIGVAGRNAETPTLHALINRADQAMYIAKDAGRNRVVVK